MGQFLSQPLTDKVVEYKELDRFSYCLGSMQGYRLTQEDAHSTTFESNIPFTDINSIETKLDIKIFGIYDGHGGSQSSNYLCENLPTSILNEIKSKNSYTANNIKTNQGLIISKFKNSFFNTDFKLYKKFQHHSSNSGSTAIVGTIINNTELYALNTGDSRIIVSINGYAKNLSFDHKPNHIGELIRINDAGGSVSYNRVGGVLALSRAFGDFNFKLRQFRQFNSNDNKNNQDINGFEENKLVSEETQVTVEPECIYHKITLNDEFIILACDGIWDVFKNQDLINYIRHRLAMGVQLDEIVTKLLEYTLTLADQTTGVGFDNMSIIIIACQYDGETLAQWYQRMKLKIEIEKGIV